MLDIHLIGRFETRNDGVLLKIPSRASQSLFAFLAIHAGKRFRREKLAGIFWPEREETKARRQLRQALWNLRDRIGHEFFLTDRISIGFNQDAEYYLDVEVLENEDLWSEPSTAFIQRVPEYIGELLPGFYEEWVDQVRRRLKNLNRKNMQILLDRLLADRRWLDVLHCGGCWIAQDDVPEQVYRALMNAHYGLGDSAGVTEVYQQCVKRLHEELDVEVSPETRDLYLQLQTEEVPASTPQDMQHGLYHPVSSFIGREEELDSIRDRLNDPSYRLLTLVGPGGVGKTRLALQVARESINEFAHGVFFIPLEHTHSPDLMISKVANELGFDFSEGSSLEKQLINYLRDKEILLVLDNLEHLLEGAATLIDILEAAEGVKILATSREQLNLSGEWVTEVQGLTYPEWDDIERVDRYSAIQLFIDRARRASSQFDPTEYDLISIARLCRLVEGVPLAIELASACGRALSCEEIATEIETNIDFLAKAPRDGPERQKSLRASFNHSWELLSDLERSTMRKLSVFRGGFRREAASCVADASPHTLISLVEKSLLRCRIAGRYEIHPLIRQFVEEELSKEEHKRFEVQALHSRYFADFAHQQAKNFWGEKQNEALDSVLEEIDNVRAALHWAIEQCAKSILANLVDILRVFYDVRGWYPEGDLVFGQVAESIEAAAPSSEPMEADTAALLAKAFAGRGWFCHRLCREEEANALLLRSLKLTREFGYREIEGDCLDSLAVIALREGNYPKANKLFQQCIVIWNELNNDGWLATDLICQSHVARSMGRFQEAMDYALEGLSKSKEVGNPWRIASALCARGTSARELKDYEEATRCYLGSMKFSESIGWRGGIARAKLGLGHIAYQRGEYDEAKEYCQQSWEIFMELGKKIEIPTVLTLLGDIHKAEKDLKTSERYFWEALVSAMAIESSPEILRSFVGLAPVLVRQGEVKEAIRLLLFTKMHPATKSLDREKADRLYNDLLSDHPQGDMEGEQEEYEGMKPSELARKIMETH